MGWAGHAEYMGEKRNLYEILIRNTEDKDYLEDLGTGGRVWIGFI
jgi:hypothetical protein